MVFTKKSILRRLLSPINHPLLDRTFPSRQFQPELLLKN
jgi:hypothetical protein